MPIIWIMVLVSTLGGTAPPETPFRRNWSAHETRETCELQALITTARERLKPYERFECDPVEAWPAMAR
jgi:hypothetical protein